VKSLRLDTMLGPSLPSKDMRQELIPAGNTAPKGHRVLARGFIPARTPRRLIKIITAIFLPRLPRRHK
jgi:hypothetical protein